MSINPVSSFNAGTSIMDTSRKNSSIPQIPADSTVAVKSDSTLISQKAKDLAAKLAGSSFQEEANESASAKMMESDSQ